VILLALLWAWRAGEPVDRTRERASRLLRQASNREGWYEV
jgi:hypothetical protein